MWETRPAPAGLALVAGINEREQRNDWEIEIPWVLGLIGTRSTDQAIPGIKQIKARNRERIISGMQAVEALERLRADRGDLEARSRFESHKADLGFGLLVRQYVRDLTEVTPPIIDRVVDDTIPRVAPMFWSFRLMVALGFLMLVLFALAFWQTVKGRFTERRWLLKWALWMLPAPWIACELGWFVAEYGRQPWTIYGVLPTHMSVSNLSVASLYGSLAGFVVFYTVLLAVEMYLMVKFARQGPGSLGTGRYDLDVADALAHP